MSEQRGHGQHEIEDMSDIVDNISNLPNHILHEILSFMPTKEVVKNSILSTRWKNLWASVPSIDFNDELLMAKEVYGRRRPDVKPFVKFVERVLRLRDASTLEKFRLTCHCFYPPSLIHSWISHAIMHNVQELDLSLCAIDPRVIPWCMFHNTSLVSLKIRMDCAIQLPSRVSFPRLKTFHLAFVRFLNDDCTEEIFSGCPVLEELVLSDCKWMNLKNIAISSSTLKSLTIYDWSLYDSLQDFGGGKMKLDAANLSCFEYDGFITNEILVNNASSLQVKACLNILPHPKQQKLVACRTVNLLKQLQHVVSLSVSGLTLKSLSFEEDIHFPIFPNLIHLMLTMKIGMNHTFKVLMDLLSSCPVLQSICFSEGFMCFMHLGENNSIWSSMPTCISNCLKTVTLKKFRGYYISEICFLKGVLKTARVLERMDIWWSDNYQQGLRRKTKVMKDLEETKRISTACVIKFL